MLTYILSMFINWGTWMTLYLFPLSIYLGLLSMPFLLLPLLLLLFYKVYRVTDTNVVRFLLGYCRSLKQVGITPLFLDWSLVLDHLEWYRFPGSMKSVIYVEDSHTVSERSSKLGVLGAAKLEQWPIKIICFQWQDSVIVSAYF